MKYGEPHSVFFMILLQDSLLVLYSSLQVLPTHTFNPIRVRIFDSFMRSSWHYERVILHTCDSYWCLLFLLIYIVFIDRTSNRLEGMGLAISSFTLYLGLWVLHSPLSKLSSIVISIVVFGKRAYWTHHWRYPNIAWYNISRLFDLCKHPQAWI